MTLEEMKTECFLYVEQTLDYTLYDNHQNGGLYTNGFHIFFVRTVYTPFSIHFVITDILNKAKDLK